jgi:hypothetical protein
MMGLQHPPSIRPIKPKDSAQSKIDPVIKSSWRDKRILNQGVIDTQTKKDADHLENAGRIILRPKNQTSLIEPVLNSERCWGNGSDGTRPTFFDTTLFLF